MQDETSPPETTTPDEIEYQDTVVDYVRPWMYDLQQRAIFDPARFVFIEASTKAGKTLGCLYWLIEQALKARRTGRNFSWVAPVSAQSDIAFTRIMTLLPRTRFTPVRSGVKRIILFNGSVIWFRSADNPDTLYGDDNDAIVVDEASRMKEDAWNAVASTLTATEGPARIIGNVHGRKNWFYRMARQAQQGHAGWSYHKIIAHDAVQAGVLSAMEIESARLRNPEHVFRELYLAEAGDDGGNPFGLDAIARCVAPLSIARPVVWGIDLAKKQDYTVAIALDATRRVCRFERWQWPWLETIGRIQRLVVNVPALVDSTGVGDPVVETLQRGKIGSRYEGYGFTMSSKQKLMEGLAVTVQSQGTTFPEGPIKFELEQFGYEITRTGVHYSAPEGMHDDCVMALGLANYHFDHAPRPMRVSDAALRNVMASGLRRH